ncbi:hypothetical protein ACWPOB_23360 [Rhodococcus sp. 2H158]
MSDPGPADTDERPPDSEELTAASAAASAARYLAELTTARPLAATSVEPSEEPCGPRAEESGQMRGGVGDPDVKPRRHGNPLHGNAIHGC